MRKLRRSTMPTPPHRSHRRPAASSPRNSSSSTAIEGPGTGTLIWLHTVVGVMVGAACERGCAWRWCRRSRSCRCRSWR